MAKYKVVQQYEDLQLNETLKVDEEVEMTVKRAEEVENTLSDKGFTGPFLERLNEKK